MTDATGAASTAEATNGADKALLSAALSKMISVSIGDIVVLLSRSSAHRHYTLADLESLDDGRADVALLADMLPATVGAG